MGYPLDILGTICGRFVQGSLDISGTIWRRGREGEGGVERGKPHLYTLPWSHFLPSRSATPCAAPPAPREAATKILPNLSKNPWTNWGEFWPVRPGASGALEVGVYAHIPPLFESSNTHSDFANLRFQLSLPTGYTVMYRPVSFEISSKKRRNVDPTEMRRTSL